MGTVTQLHPRPAETTPDSAMTFARNLVSADRVTAARIAAALTAILEASTPCLT